MPKGLRKTGLRALENPGSRMRGLTAIENSRKSLVVLSDLKDVVNHATIMPEQTVENINLARWVIKMPDRIKKFVPIALKHIIVPKNEFQRALAYRKS